MSKVSIEVDGLEQLEANLEDLSNRVAHKVLRETLKDTADFLQEKIVERAPNDTGFLGEHFNVRVRVKANELEAEAFVGPAGKVYYPGGLAERGVATGKHPHAGGLVPVVSVARFLEFGTQGPGRHRITPRPFMTQAFEENKDGCLVKIVQGIKDAIGRFLR